MTTGATIKDITIPNMESPLFLFCEAIFLRIIASSSFNLLSFLIVSRLSSTSMPDLSLNSSKKLSASFLNLSRYTALYAFRGSCKISSLISIVSFRYKTSHRWLLIFLQRYQVFFLQRLYIRFLPSFYYHY